MARRHISGMTWSVPIRAPYTLWNRPITQLIPLARAPCLQAQPRGAVGGAHPSAVHVVEPADHAVDPLGSRPVYERSLAEQLAYRVGEPGRRRIRDRQRDVLRRGYRYGAGFYTAGVN